MRFLSFTSTWRLAAAVLFASVLGTIVATGIFAWAHGERMYVVKTGSMVPTYQPGDVVLYVARPRVTESANP